MLPSAAISCSPEHTFQQSSLSFCCSWSHYLTTNSISPLISYTSPARPRISQPIKRTKRKSKSRSGNLLLLLQPFPWQPALNWGRRVLAFSEHWWSTQHLRTLCALATKSSRCSHCTVEETETPWSNKTSRWKSWNLDTGHSNSVFDKT